jgi:hypothetical protein
LIIRTESGSRIQKKFVPNLVGSKVPDPGFTIIPPFRQEKIDLHKPLKNGMPNLFRIRLFRFRCLLVYLATKMTIFCYFFLKSSSLGTSVFSSCRSCIKSIKLILTIQQMTNLLLYVRGQYRYACRSCV